MFHYKRLTIVKKQVPDLGVYNDHIDGNGGCSQRGLVALG